MRKGNTVKVKMKAPRQFEAVVHVSGPLEGGFDDWPANIQDGIYRALEKKSKEVKLPLIIVNAVYEYDSVEYGHYIRITAWESFLNKKVAN